MTEPSHDDVTRLVGRASRLREEDRAEFLNEACAGDPELRAEVESLLAHLEPGRALIPEGDQQEMLARHAGGLVGLASDPRALPDRIGRFTILRLLGEGGMGRVYEAEQERPRRRVALKILRTEGASAEMVRRFEREAELLASLQHPGIARVFEVGSFEPLKEDGRRTPFLSMELVDGVPITDHADRLELGVRGRLDLLARTCEAVQHAHDRGIVHRDLKPANVLVDGSGQPKVLDFGIARATDGELASSLLTRTGQVLGTPAYMSPEQASGQFDTVDGRSDVYALGMIGYRLLCGHLPADLADVPPLEALRRVQGTDWDRLGSVSTDLRGDVEIIVATAVDKDRDRRYASPAALAADIRRHLESRAIVARPASVAYRVTKFARRHSALVVATLVTILGLATGLVVAVHQGSLATKAGEEAVALRDQARRQAYSVGIREAGTRLLEHDAARARDLLAEAPPELRRWEHRFLSARLDDSVAALETSDLRFRYPAFTADARHVYMHRASTRGHLSRWDPATGAVTEVADLRERPLRVPADALQHAVERLVIRPGETLVEVRDADTDEELLTVRACEEQLPAQIAAFSLAGRTMVLEPLPRGRPWQVCDWSSGRALTEPMTDGISDAGWAFSRDGRHLAWGPGNGGLRLLTLASGREVELVPSSSIVDTIASIVFSADGATLYSALHDGRVTTWDVASGRRAPSTRLPGSGSPHLVLSADGRFLAAAVGGTVSIVPPSLGAPLAVMHHPSNARSLVAVDLDGTRLVTLESKHGMRTWDARGRTVDTFALGDACRDLSVDPNGRLLAVDTRRTVRLHDLPTGRMIAELGEGVRRARRGLGFDATGGLLAAGDAGGGVELWDVWTGRRLATTPPLGPPDEKQRIAHVPGHWIVTSSSGVHVLDETTLASRWRVPESKIAAAAPTASGGLATVAEDGRLTLWNVSAGQPALELEVESGGQALDCSPDEHRLVVGREHLTVWDLEEARPVARAAAQEGGVLSLAFSPDGTRLASTGMHGVLRIWDADDLEMLLEWDASPRPVVVVAWAPDGETLYTGSQDGTVRSWSTTDLRDRIASRESAQEAWSAMGSVVERLHAELGDSEEVVARLRADSRLSRSDRDAALSLTLERATSGRGDATAH